MGEDDLARAVGYLTALETDIEFEYNICPFCMAYHRNSKNSSHSSCDYEGSLPDYALPY